MNIHKADMLQGKVALVTGAGRGVGRAEALALAAVGCAVVVNDLGTGIEGGGQNPDFADEVVREITERGGRAVADHGDIADPKHADTMIRLALDSFGRLDIVVNNAGNQPPAKVLPDIDLDDLDRTLRVHVRGSFCISAAATRHWREEARRLDRPVDARLILTASEGALMGAPWRADYVAAKSAIIGLMLAAAQSCIHFGVRVNAICPRADTRMTRLAGQDMAYAADDAVHGPENVAPLIVALCGPEGADVNGQVMVCGWGTFQILDGPSIRFARDFDEVVPIDALQSLLREKLGQGSPIYSHAWPGRSFVLDQLRDQFDFLPRSFKQ